MSLSERVKNVVQNIRQPTSSINFYTKFLYSVITISLFPPLLFQQPGLANSDSNIRVKVTKSDVQLSKLKHIKYILIDVLFRKLEHKETFSLFITLVLWIKEITNLSGRLSFNQAAMINLLITKAETSHKNKFKKRIKII